MSNARKNTSMVRYLREAAAAAAAAANAPASAPVERTSGLPAEQSTGLAEIDAPPGEELDGGDVDEIIKLAPGESLEGEYRGAKNTRAKKSDDTNLLHKFIIATVPTGLWGTQQLNSMLERCNSGDIVWVGYLGKEALENGNDMHRWRVVRRKKASATPFG